MHTEDEILMQFLGRYSYYMAEERNGNGPANGHASPGIGIDLNNFSRRLEALYAYWKEHRNDIWGGSDVFAIATPSPSDDLRYLKSSAMNIWLLGYEFPETIMVFGEKQIHFVCSQSKASLLDVVKKAAKEVVGADVVMHVKARYEDGTPQMGAVLCSIGTELKSPVIGYIAKEAPEGKLLEI